jgi:hypothetical protein
MTEVQIAEHTDISRRTADSIAAQPLAEAVKNFPPNVQSIFKDTVAHKALANSLEAQLHPVIRLALGKATTAATLSALVSFAVTAGIITPEEDTALMQYLVTKFK